MFSFVCFFITDFLQGKGMITGTLKLKYSLYKSMPQDHFRHSDLVFPYFESFFCKVFNIK